jgi:hypothetical protein
VGPIGCPKTSLQNCHYAASYPRRAQISRTSRRKPEIYFTTSVFTICCQIQARSFSVCMIFTRSRDSSVDTVTRLRAGQPRYRRSLSSTDRDSSCFKASRPARGPTHLLCSAYPGRPGPYAGQLPPSSAEVKNEWNCLHYPMWLHGVDTDDMTSIIVTKQMHHTRFPVTLWCGQPSVFVRLWGMHVLCHHVDLLLRSFLWREFVDTFVLPCSLSIWLQDQQTGFSCHM